MYRERECIVYEQIINYILHSQTTQKYKYKNTEIFGFLESMGQAPLIQVGLVSQHPVVPPQVPAVSS